MLGVSSLRLLDTKLPPRAAFTAQIIGTLFGAILNYGAYLLLLTPWDCGLDTYQS